LRTDDRRAHTLVRIQDQCYHHAPEIRRFLIYRLAEDTANSLMKLHIGILGYLMRSVGIVVGESGSLPRCVHFDDGIDWRSSVDELWVVPHGIIDKLLPSFLYYGPGKVLTVTTAVTGYDPRFLGNRFRFVLSASSAAASQFHLSSIPEAAHMGAFLGGDGVLLRCGHSASAFTRIGRPGVITGAWNTVGGDEASGTWLGHQALHCITRYHDGSATLPRSALAVEILRRLERRNPTIRSDAPTLLEELHMIRETQERAWKHRLYEIGLEVVRIAQSDSTGSEFALRIVEDSQEQLVDLVYGGLSQSGVSKIEPFDICLSGSIFGDRWYVTRFIENLRRAFPSVNVKPPLYSPIMGIALMAVQNGDGLAASDLPLLASTWGNEPWAKPIIRG